jgi:phosphoribosyl 1,2-cyclic phosphodiesterase
MKVTFWGTRGSQAAPGPETVRYGGNTSCVEVEVVPESRVVLDAGTGLRRLGTKLPPEVRRVDVLLTHLHMDHLQGLGFFDPLFQPGFEVHIWGPGSATTELRQRLTRYMSPPLFPVRLPELPCELHVHDLNNASVEVPGIVVRAALVCHPGPTVGLRLETEHASLAYLPDHEPVLAHERFAHSPEWCSGFDLAHEVDVLIHDSQYDELEYRERVGWGHSTLRHAIAFAEVTNAKTLVPFHHDPAHDDDMLDATFAKAASNAVEIAVLGEGETFLVGNTAD